MNKADITSLYASMPERQQAQGVIAHVKNLISSGNTRKAREFFDEFNLIEGHDYAKAVIGKMLISAYGKCGETDAAIGLYELLENLPSEDDVSYTVATALLTLASILLPERLNIALTFWERLAKRELPLEALWAMSKTGIKILKIAISNEDKDTQKRVYRYLYPDAEMI